MPVNSISEVNAFLKNMYVDSGLYGSPVPIKEQADGLLECVYFLAIDDHINYSVVMPIHNQGSIIQRNLQALMNCISGSYELILILDACEDNTKSEVLWFLNNVSCAFGLNRIIVVESDVPLFETVCDNIGFRLASGKWFLEIQADMKMTEKEFNWALTKPFLSDDKVIAVSGRCCHSLDQREIIGRGGHAIERTVSELGLDRSLFYVHEVCNRGPLLLDAAKVKAMGYLDETNFYLDYSEIDMVLRAYDAKGWICGYVPIDFESPLSDGSTRKVRDPLNEYILNVRRNRAVGGGGINSGFVATYRRRGLFRPGYTVKLQNNLVYK
jgi:glycosyltransferase involved in cell wall biosynthesis